jgi:hypothetical protein
MIHLSQAGLDDRRALADARRAIQITDLDTWSAARELATTLRCRALFDAPIRSLPEAAALREHFRLSFRTAGWLREHGPLRDHALGLLTVQMQPSLAEQALLAARFIRLHPGAMAESVGVSRRAWCVRRGREAAGSLQLARELQREMTEMDAE